MQKSKGIKIAALLCGAIAAITGIVLVVSHMLGGEEFYRSILIYELNGTASIEREGAGEINAAEDLYLESGDRISVAEGSSMRLKLDDDKYLMVEEESVLSVEAAGSEEDSKTKIQLEEGAVTSEIQNPLSPDSKYEVNSPNSVMAVRGTIFRVETTVFSDEDVSTKVSVFSGKVSMGALQEDGSVGDEILIGAGEEAECDGGLISGTVLSEPAEIDFQSLSLQALEFLTDLAEQDAPITGISKDELSALVEEARAWESEDEESDDETEEEMEEAEDADIDEEDMDEPEDEEDDEEDSQADKTASSGNSNNNTGTTPRTPTNPGTIPRSPSNPRTPSPNPGTTPQNPQNPGTPPQNPQNPGTTQQNPQNPGTTQQNPGTPGTTPQTAEYTVSFMYNGTVFATQTVKEGECVTKPSLKPEASGTWDFDFSTKIKKDTTIKWK